MSRYINDETAGQTFLSSNQGWGDFSRWVDGLEAKAAPDLIHLVEHGWTENISAMREQLNAALKNHKPSKDVEDIAFTLLRASAVASVLVISDGVQPGEAI